MKTEKIGVAICVFTAVAALLLINKTNPETNPAATQNEALEQFFTETAKALQEIKDSQAKTDEQLASLKKELQSVKAELREFHEQIATGWPITLWKSCWHKELEYLDFTTSAWRQLSLKEQLEYAQYYQVWYAQRMGLKVEKSVMLGSEECTFVLIPPGRYWFGSPPIEKNRRSNETYNRELVKKAFWVSKYEITQGQWKALMGSNSSRFEGDNLPVDQLGFLDAKAFVHKAQETHKKLRLPSEVEWEYACRAGTFSAFYFGTEITPQEVNFASPSRGGNRNQTISVGSLKRPNAWGAHDFHGNVWEWTEDGSKRGGSWNSTIDNCRAAVKYRSPEESNASGLRLCLDL